MGMTERQIQDSVGGIFITRRITSGDKLKQRNGLVGLALDFRVMRGQDRAGCGRHVRLTAPRGGVGASDRDQWAALGCSLAAD